MKASDYSLLMPGRWGSGTLSRPSLHDFGAGKGFIFPMHHSSSKGARTRDFNCGTCSFRQTDTGSGDAAPQSWLYIAHCNFAYSAWACFRMGMSGSASFQSVNKS